MIGPRTRRMGLLLVLACLLATTPGAAQIRLGTTPSTTTFTPRFEAVAETKLIMEGLANANYQSLHRLLRRVPKDNETWVFARGQAILLAETGNLLLLRPPRNSGRDTWMKLGMDMRGQAATVARKVGARDHEGSKEALQALTNSCNRCHQTFRVPVRVGPEPDRGERDT